MLNKGIEMHLLFIQTVHNLSTSAKNEATRCPKPHHFYIRTDECGPKVSLETWIEGENVEREDDEAVRV